jgi:UDP-glucose 4-epimerase
LNALITGGAGFIGSHLADRLVEDGHAVVVLDDLSTGRRENLAAAEASGTVRFVQADVADFDAIRPHFDGVDVVLHLAGLADIVPSISQPRRYHRANVDGTLAVLESAREAGVARVVYAASSSCYGIAERAPTPEDAPIRPAYPYALTKWMGEQLVLHWAGVYGLGAVSLRLFNVYGPRSRTTGAYGAVFGVFLAQRANGRPLTIVGDGTQTRDFVFVSDVADAFAAAALSDVTGEVFNVGSGAPQSVNRLAELVGGPVTHLPKRPGEPDVTHADIGKISRSLGWGPKVSFEDGVRIMMARLADWRHAPVWTPERIHEATREWFDRLGAARRA